MADYTLNYEGEEINRQLAQLVGNTFTALKSGVAPASTPASDANIPTTGWVEDMVDEKVEDKSTVSYTQITPETGNTHIGTITIDSTAIPIYAPVGGSGSGDTVAWNQITASGTKIATITINSTSYDVYVPTATSDVTGVKGDAESTYRTGNINITAANVGAYVKPSDGIPSTDLASSVQTSLGKADSALQSHQDITGKLDKLGGTMGGRLNANATAVATLANSQMRNIYAGTTDMTAGTTILTTGDIYLVYE